MRHDELTDDDCLWRKTAPDPPPVDRLDGDVTCDVAVIGGGLTGSRAALALVEAGVNVVVLEKEVIGFGASGRSGGQVNLGFKIDPDDLERQMGQETAGRMLRAASNSSNELFDLVRRYQLNCDAVQKGWVKASHCSVALERQKRQLDQWARRGIELELLNRDDIERHSGAHGYVGGLLYRQGGSIQPLAYTRELARVAVQRGARFFERAEALDVSSRSDGIRIKCRTGSVRAEALLICTNGYTGGLWPNLERSVVPIRSIQAATEPLPSDLRREILPQGNTLSDMRHIIFYFRLDRDHRLCFGGVGPMRDRLTRADFRSLIKGAESVFPSLKGLRWDHHWGGRLGMTRDSLPQLHELAPNVYAGIGFNGRGIGLGTLMGRLLAELVLGKSRQELDFPVTAPKTYPFYAFRRLGFGVVTSWLAFRDRVDLWRG